jgi:tape measure domain-containing protein
MRIVDTRLVQMGFDNKQFEQGVKTSLESLLNLKNGLKLEGAQIGLKNLADYAKTFSLNTIASGVDHISSKFSALGAVGLTVFQNLTTAVINLGKQMLNSFVAPAKSGFQEYETQMDAIQTMLANTQSKGTTLEDVNNTLAELNAYADNTIYNFSQMTKNMGLFTAAGVDLETSATSIKGIANLAAMSGVKNEDAARAMYQLSQAISSGTVRLMDWNSVQNAGLGGEAFKNSLMETARVHGVAVDDLIAKNGSFRDSLSEGWLTADIMTETLAKFTGDLSTEQLKALGYTDQQVKSIMELATTANDAATKVKTLTQLQSTLQEAMGSGWARSWQIIFGDFEEAKVLFTEISDTLGGLIGASSDARNKVLEDWKKFGGRVALIDALRNTFQGVLSIITPIGEAFRDIFPPITGQRLKLITVAIRDLTAKLIIGKDTAEKLKITFKGIFTIFKFVIDVVFGLIKGIGILFGLIPASGGDVLSFFTNLSSKFIEFEKSLNITEKINKAFKKLAEYIKQIGIFITPFIKSVINFFNEIKSKLADTFDKIDFKGIFLKVLETFKKVKNNITEFFNKLDFTWFFNFINNIKTAFNEVSNSIKNLFSGLPKIAEGTNSKFSNLKKTINGIKEAIKDFFNKIDFSKIFSFFDFSKITENIKKIDFGKIFAGVTLGGFTALIISFIKFLKDLGSVAVGAKDLLGGVVGVLDGVKESLTAWQTALKAKSLLQIAAAVAILAIAIIAISLVDPTKLATSMAAISGMFAQLVISLSAINKIPGGGGAQMALMLIGLALALMFLALAISLLAKLDVEEIGRGLVIVQAMIIPIFSYSKLLKDGAPGLIKVSIGIIALSISLMFLSLAIRSLGTIPWEQAWNGLMWAGIALLGIVAFFHIMPKDKAIIKASISIGLLSISLIALALAITSFGLIPWEVAWNGLMWAGIALVGITAFYNTLPSNKNLIASAISVTILSASLLLLALAITSFGLIPWEQAWNGLMWAGLALLGITAFYNTLPKNKDLISASIAVTILSGSLLLLALAVASFGNIPWDVAWNGLMWAGLALAGIVGALKLLNGTKAIGASVAMLIMAIAINTLVPAIMLLGEMSWESLATSLAAIAGVFLIFGYASWALSSAVPVLLALSAAMFIFGLAAFLVGASVFKFAMGLILLSTLGAGAIATITLIVMGLIALIPLVATAIADGMAAFSVSLSKNAPEIAKGFQDLLLAFIDTIKVVGPELIATLETIIFSLLDSLERLIPKFIDVVLNILTEIYKSLADNADEMVQAGMDILIAFLKGIKDNMFEIVTTVADIIVEFLKGITEKLPDIILAGYDVIISFINGLATAVEEKGPEINAAIGNLASAIVKGLSDGISNGVGSVVDAISKLAGGAIDALKDLLGIFSPSRVFTELGEYTGEGFGNGILAMSSTVAKSTEALGESAISGINKVIDDIASTLSSDLDMVPVIRPVVDLTDVTNSGKVINKLFGAKTLDLSSTLAKVSKIGATSKEDNQNGSSSQAVTSSIVFNQNNYSPKALDRLEVYRQTRNQLASLKGLIKT